MAERIARFQGGLLNVAQHRVWLAPPSLVLDQRHGLTGVGEIGGGQGFGREVVEQRLTSAPTLIGFSSTQQNFRPGGVCLYMSINQFGS